MFFSFLFSGIFAYKDSTSIQHLRATRRTGTSIYSYLFDTFRCVEIHGMSIHGIIKLIMAAHSAYSLSSAPLVVQNGLKVLSEHAAFN